jgi:hypothetical protein
MKIFLIVDSKRFKVTEPSDGSSYAIVEKEACPHCTTTPFKIAGSGKQITTDDRAYEAEGFCLACLKYVGTIRAEPSTLFGLHEDEAVLHGRCRVY